MIEIQAPNKIPDNGMLKIFLAGSIEMGSADNWQKRAVEMLSGENVIVLNPRRNDWNDSWVQSEKNPEFKEQVKWELDALERSDHIVMYFDPKTKSPISLLEEGLYARTGKLLVVCPEGFWKKGNIDIVSHTYGAPEFSTIEEAIAHLKTLLHKNS